MLSREDALAILADAKLSRHQYEVIRKKAPEKFPKKAPEKFPSYKVLQVGKQECYPKSDCIKVTSTSAEVSLQALLNHTMNRFISVQQRVVNELNNAELDKLCLYTKWGFDGSSGHSAYKQAFHGIKNKPIVKKKVAVPSSSSSSEEEWSYSDSSLEDLDLDTQESENDTVAPLAWEVLAIT
ncbi:hypothetical protein QE152_g1788 [Popillia japonica]|uniref:Uncharacterized protein n=1 Tax=Popillia japonica TaxID=7064 RepID=A0AAW1N8D6_POPJA